MPTDKQLFDSWRANDILELSNGNYCNDHSPEPVNERNYNNVESNLESTGKKIGVISYNPKKIELSNFIYKSRGRK